MGGPQKIEFEIPRNWSWGQGVIEEGGKDQDQERYLKKAYNRVRRLRQKQAETSSSGLVVSRNHLT